MKYLNTKPGSIEEVAANMSKHTAESGYQDMFKKELEKAGKGIGSMTPAEKKAFFNKIDTKYKAKDENVSQKDIDKFHTSLDKLVHKSFGHSSDEKKKEMKEAVKEPYAVGMAAAMKSTGDKPPLKKSTITKAHDIAKSIEKDQKNEEKDVPKGYHKMPDGTIMKDSEHKKEEVKENASQVQVKSDGKGNYNLMYKGKEIGYYHKQGGKYIVYHDKDEDDYNQSDEVSTEMQAKKMAFDSMNETHTFMTKDMNQKKKDAKGEKEIVDPEPKIKQESIQDAIANVWKMSAEELEKIKTEAKYMKAQRLSQYKAEKDDKNKKGTADTGSKETQVDIEPSVDYKN